LYAAATTKQDLMTLEEGMRMRWPVCLVLVLVVGCADMDGEAAIGTSRSPISVTWTNVVGASATGDSLLKTNPLNSWNAGAVSVSRIEGDGYVEFTTGENTTAKMVGLSAGDDGQSYSDIDFALFLKANGNVGIYEAGVLRGDVFATYVAGDVFRVEADDGVVSYSLNGAIIFTSQVAPSHSLRVDTSLRSPGATVQDVVLIQTGLTWQNAVGVATGPDSLTKTASGTSWSAGASTGEALTGEGFVEFTTAENNTAKMVGLSSDDSSQHFSDIDFAIYLTSTGRVRVSEAGVIRSGNFGPYIPGDVFRVEVVGGVVRYSMNGGQPFHTSATPPSFPLLVDTSLSTPGATVQGIALTDAAEACPAYDGVGLACLGSYTVENSIDLADIAGCNEITGNLTIRAPGMPLIALPALERIGGTLTIDSNADLERLRLPQLREVRGGLTINLEAVTTGFDLSRLGTAGHTYFYSDGTPVSLGCLQSARSIDSGAAPEVARPLLLERLAAVTGPVSGPIDAPALTEVAGVLTYGSRTKVPSLQHARSLTLLDPAVIDLPALREVSDVIAGGVISYNDLCYPGSIAVTSFELPALERAGAVRLCWSALQTVSLPQLQVITGAEFGARSLFIRATGPTSDLSALTEVTGDVRLYASTSLPQLTRVDGALVAGGSISAPALAEVTSTVTVATGAGSLSLPALTTAGGVVAYATDLTALDLPALTTVTTTSGVIVRDTLVSTVAMPSLVTIAGKLNLSNNDAMTSLAFPALTSIGAFLTIQGNLVLPSCYATDIRDQLIASGWSGTVYIGNNTGTGTCE
jgi:hypothetical protein